MSMCLTGTFVASLIVMAALTLAGQAAPPGVKVGTVHLQNALLKTKEGQAAAAQLQRNTEIKEQSLKKLQLEIAGLREQLNKSGSVASASKQESLSKKIEQKTKTFNRQLEDLQAEVDGEQGRILNDLGGRMLATIRRFANSGGYSLIVDVSAPQSPVLYVSEPLDVTADVIKMFDAAESTTPKPGSK